MRFKKLLTALLLSFPLVQAQGISSMLDTAQYSRGMMLFFLCLAILIAFPFINKQIKSIMLIPFLFILGRGLIRIGEQDIVKAFTSVLPGLKVGVPLAIVLVVVSAILFVPVYLLRKANIIKPETTDSLEKYFKEGTKKGHDIESLKKALYLQGISKIDVDDAAQSAISSPLLRKITEKVKGKKSVTSLKDYFDQGLKKGYSVSALKMTLVKKGFEQSVVEKASDRFKKPESYLEEYIQKGLKKGFKIESLKKALLKQGVDSKDLENAINKVTK